jgi:hypothetical protein
MESEKPFQRQIFDLIKSMTGQGNVLTIPVLFTKKLNNDLNAAIFLSQLIYWSDRGKHGGGWIYKTYKEWQEELCLSRRKIDRAREKLTKLQLLETRVKRANGAPTVHYRVNSKNLVEWICSRSKNGFEQNEQNDLRNTSKISTETTKKTTPEKNDNYDGCRTSPTATPFLELTVEMRFMVSYYLKKYQKVLGYKHSTLKKEQWDRVTAILKIFINEYGLSYDDIKNIVDHHFERNLDTDFNINHFATEGILQNLIFKVGCY